MKSGEERKRNYIRGLLSQFLGKRAWRQSDFKQW